MVVLGHSLWLQRFAGDPSISGKSVSLSGHPFTVVGIAPPGFHSVDQLLDCQFWVPLGTLDMLLPNSGNDQKRDYHWLAVVGRLRSQPAQAIAELKLIANRIVEAHPEGADDDGFSFEQAGSLPMREKSTVLLFITALCLVALMVLGIAGANVCNLFLVQAASRQREFAVRLALGATRRHLLQQMLTESIMLALCGGLVGVALSLWSTHALSAFRFPAPVPLIFR